jgi:hypothetical protein
MACGSSTIRAWVVPGIALDIGVVEYGFALFLISSLLWCAVGLVQHEPSLVVLQAVFTGINILGLWRWVGH